MGPKALYVDNSAPSDTVNAANFYWGTADKVGTYTAVISLEASGNSTVDVNDAAYGVVNATTYYTTQPSVFTPDSLSVGTGLSLNLMYALGGVTNTTLGLTGNVRLVSSNYHYGMALRVKDANGTVVQTSTADFDTAYSGGGYPYTYSSGARVTIAVEESFGVNFNSLAQGAYTVEAAFSDRAGNLGSFTQVKAFEWDGTPADITVTDATSYRDDASDVIGLTLTPTMLSSKVGTSQTLSLYYVRTDQYTAGTAAKDIVAALSGKPVDTWKSETVTVTSNNPVSLQKTPTDLASLSNGSYAVIVKDEAGVYKMASQTIAIHPTRIANTLDSYVVFDDPSNTVTVRLKTYGDVTLGSGAAATAINLVDQAGNTWVANYAGKDAQGLLYSFTLPTGNEAISSLQMAAGQSLTFSDITIGGSVPSITTAASSLPGTNINVPTTVVEQSLNTANFGITTPLAGATYEYWDYSSANASKWTAIPTANLSAFVPLGQALSISPNLFSTNYSTTKQTDRPLNADVTGAADLSAMGVITAGANNNSDNKMLYSVVKTATGNATNDGVALAGFAIYRVAADIKIVYRKDGDSTSTTLTTTGAFSNGIAAADVYTVGFSLGAVSGSNRELKVFVGGDITSGLTSAAYDTKLLPSEFPLREYTFSVPLAAVQLTNTGTSGLNKWTVYDGVTYRNLTNQLIEMMGGNVTATGVAEGGSSNFNSPLSLGSGTFSTPGWQSDALMSSYASTTPLFYAPLYTAASQPLQIRVTDVYGNIKLISVPLANFTAGNQFTVVAGDFASSPDVALSQIALEDSTTDFTSVADYALDDLFLVTATDSNGAAVDYLDEATGQMLDMAIKLRGFASVAELDGGTHVTVSPLTELAVRLATSAGGSMTQQTAKEAVLAVQNVFHVDDLNGDVLTVTSSDYNEADGISSAEHMGQILALLSGGDTVMGSMDAALAQLEAILSGQVTPKNVSVIFGQWSRAFEAGPNGHLADLSGLVESLSALHGGASTPTTADIQNAATYRIDPVAFQQLTWQSGGSDVSATSSASTAGTAGSNDLTLQMVLDREDGPGMVLGDHVKVYADGELVYDYQEHGAAGQLMSDLSFDIDLSQVSAGNRADGQVVLSLKYEHYGNSPTPVVMDMADHWTYRIF
jgi:hypothetical protein